MARDYIAVDTNTDTPMSITSPRTVALSSGSHPNSATPVGMPFSWV